MATRRRKCVVCQKNRQERFFVSERGRVCKDCRTAKRRSTTKNLRLYQTYGITLEQYDQILFAQGDGCAICGGKRTVYDVDHNHKTGEVRGLLCRSDNKILAYARDDATRLRSAADYLTNPPAREVLW